MDSSGFSAAGYARHGSFVPELAGEVFRLLAPQPGERILDLGCGDGALTARIAAAGARVTGVDNSPELIAAARARGLDVIQGDGQALEFDAEFDAVFSNAALHWMLRPGEVLRGVHRALKPGGRFVGEFGGKGNVASIVAALAAVLEQNGMDGEQGQPWYFPSADEYREQLERHGFEVCSIEAVERPTPLPTGMDGWLDTFARPILTLVPETAREEVKSQAVERLRPALADASGQWTADYVRLRFLASRR